MANLNIIEENRIIAGFMGYKVLPNTEEQCFTHENHPFDIFHINDFAYDSSWNCLMPVVKRMTTLKEWDEYPNVSLFWDVFTQIDLSEIYEQVIEFMHWYNENNH